MTRFFSCPPFGIVSWQKNHEEAGAFLDRIEYALATIVELLPKRLRYVRLMKYFFRCRALKQGCQLWEKQIA